MGYDFFFFEDEVEEVLIVYFFFCGVIIYVDVDFFDKMISIYFFEEEGEVSVMNFDGSEVDGFKINIMFVFIIVRSNFFCFFGEIYCGYCVLGV